MQSQAQKLKKIASTSRSVSQSLLFPISHLMCHEAGVLWRCQGPAADNLHPQPHATEAGGVITELSPHHYTPPNFPRFSASTFLNNVRTNLLFCLSLFLIILHTFIVLFVFIPSIWMTMGK